MSTATELKAELGLLDETEVAALLNMTLPSLRNQRSRKKGQMGPPFTRVGRKVFYPLADLRAYLKERTVTPGDDEPPTLIDGKRRGRSTARGSTARNVT